MTCISTNWDESTSSKVQFALFYPWPSTTSYIEYLINGIFNNSLKYCVLVWHSNPVTTNFIGKFWYNFLRNHAGGYFSGAILYMNTTWTSTSCPHEIKSKNVGPDQNWGSVRCPSPREPWLGLTDGAGLDGWRSTSTVETREFRKLPGRNWSDTRLWKQWARLSDAGLPTYPCQYTEPWPGFFLTSTD